MIDLEAVARRFWSKVDVSPGLGPSGDCWEWIGAMSSNGYGSFYFLQKAHMPHRVAWYLHYGEWPKSGACHHCDNTKCVRIDHLFDGDQQANTQDAFIKGKCAQSAWGINLAKTHCPQGHEYNEINTEIHRSPNGRIGRRCRICNARRTAALRKHQRDTLCDRLLGEC